CIQSLEDIDALSPILTLLSFFFFQAEDGIRDFHVTGVQRVLFRSNFPTVAGSTRQPWGSSSRGRRSPRISSGARATPQRPRSASDRKSVAQGTEGAPGRQRVCAREERGECASAVL